LLLVLALLVSLNPVKASQMGTVYGYVRERNPQGILEPRQGIMVELTSFVTGERRSTSTDSTGAYIFEDLAPGSYKLEFKEEGYTPIHYTFELTQGAELDIHAIIFDNSIGVAGYIMGKVVDEGGQLLENARIQLRGVDVKLDLETWLGERGIRTHFTFDVLPLGTYAITVEYPGYERWSGSVTLTKHGTRDLGQITLSRTDFIARNLALIVAVVGLAIVIALAFYLRVRRRVRRLPPPTPQPELPG